MVKETLKDHKNTLENRERTYKALSKTGRWISNLGLLLVIVGFIFYGAIPVLPIILEFFWALVFAMFLVCIGFLMIFVGVIIIRRKGVPRDYLSPDEEIFLKIFDALTFLEPYMKENIEPAKYQCLNELNEAHRLIKYYWGPSNIGLVKKEIGIELEIFKERFDRYLIFTVEQGKEIEKIYQILMEFGEYLIDPSKEKLANLNKGMRSLQFSEKARDRYPLIGLVKRHQIHKHVVFAAIFFATALFPTLFGIYYSGISMDTAYTFFAAIFAPLIAGYIIYLLKKK